MTSYIRQDTDDENIDEFEDDVEVMQSHRISNSIHNFAEIMSSNDSVKHADRFSGHYNPRRRKLLTETDQDNINNGAEKQPSNRNYELKKSQHEYNHKVVMSHEDDDESYENNNAEEFDEEIYEEASSQFMNSERNPSQFGEATFSPSNKPSTNRDTTGKIQYIEQHDNGIPEIGSSDCSKSEQYMQAAHSREYEQSKKNDMDNQSYELKNVVNEIDYIYVDQSIQNRRWINKDIMQKRDSSRAEDYKRVEAERSLKREFKQLEERRAHNIVHTNKKSKKLAKVALKKKVKTVVSTYSQNGYLAFENFLNVLYMLQITQNIGRVDEEYELNERIKRIKEDKEANELEFALQFWNKINCYLFNYVDSIILVDFLMILLSSSKHRLPTAERYVNEISSSDDLPAEDIEKNRQRNSDLYIEHPWT
jgi:hypothetical protein